MMVTVAACPKCGGAREVSVIGARVHVDYDQMLLCTGSVHTLVTTSK